jgi:hypothetical protein
MVDIPAGVDGITYPVLIMQEPLPPDQHAISALPRFHPPRAVSDGSTASAVARCMTTYEAILCRAGSDTA